MTNRFDPLGDILITRGLITAEHLARAQELKTEKSITLGAALLELRLVSEEDLCLAVSEQFNIPFLDQIDLKQVDMQVVSRLPMDYLRKNRIIPLHIEDGECRVAIADPLNLESLDDLQALINEKISPVLALEKEIMRALNSCYQTDSGTAQQVIQDMDEDRLELLEDELEETIDLLDQADDAPIIKLVNMVLYQAIRDRASDIHIEPFDQDLKVRLRIDGVLHQVLSPPKRYQSAITARIKVMSRANVAEHRLPQDGRIQLRIAGKDIDIRVSFIPTMFGERVVMRLLDKTAILLGINELGMAPDDLSNLDLLIHQSHGIILVTGPTGSGKTTTMYSCLNRINTPEKNIITIEDPVEYQLNGISQIQIKPQIGLSFASGLRSILRQDPDIIMVGEMRDLETSQTAIQASLTGHLVFSTLHTNDAPGAITRLVDMGIEPYLVASSVTAVCAQRLVRSLCRACMEEYIPSATEFAELGYYGHEWENKKIFRAAGCSECLGTGYKGRTGIFELLAVDDDVRMWILENFDSTTLKKKAIERGLVTLRDDGLRKILAGISTIEEVKRVTGEDVG